MKISSIFVLIFFTAGIGLFFPFSCSGEQSSAYTGRWDLRMIEEAPIWKNLLVNYSYAEHRKFWPERKRALEKILDKFPDSRWADDAALILACGKASFENDPNGATADLKKVVEQYPSGHTIVTYWDPEDGCRFDDTWLMWQGGLVFLNPDGTTRTAKPFHRNGEISQLEKEALAYFKHLEKYPKPTAVMAQLFISQILGLKEDMAGTIAVLEKIVSSSAAYLARINKADRIAASQSDGYYIRGLITRPEYRAYLSLIGYYEKQQKIEKAISTADKLFNLCTKDGWLWSINKHIGNFYERHGLVKKAEEQYQLALDGLMIHKKDVERRSKFVRGTDIPDNFWKNNRIELERKLMKKQKEKQK